VKIKELLDRLEKSDHTKEWVDFEKLSEQLEIYRYSIDWPEDEDSRITCYWFVNWICTDTMVGGRVYFFDGEPAAISFQDARKNDENFEWISKDMWKKVFDYMMTFYLKDLEEQGVSLVNLEEEIGNSFDGIPFNVKG